MRRREQAGPDDPSPRMDGRGPRRNAHDDLADRAGAGGTAATGPSHTKGFLARLQRLRRALLVAAALLIIGSFFLPSWSTTLHAPQYPQGLKVTISGIGVKGDVSEVDTLNHYIGMMKLEDLAVLERELWPWGVALLVVVLLLAAALRGRFAALLALGAVVYPIAFAAGLYRWLYHAGHHLDPQAPLSSSIEPFMPAIVGSKMVGQFQTTAAFGTGYWLTLMAALLGLLAAVAAWRRAPS